MSEVLVKFTTDIMKTFLKSHLVLVMEQGMQIHL